MRIESVLAEESRIMGLSRRKTDGERQKVARFKDIIEISKGAETIRSRTNLLMGEISTSTDHSRAREDEIYRRMPVIQGGSGSVDNVGGVGEKEEKEKIRKAKERVASGFYDSWEVYQTIAERLLKVFKLSDNSGI